MAGAGDALSMHRHASRRAKSSESVSRRCSTLRVAFRAKMSTYLHCRLSDKYPYFNWVHPQGPSSGSEPGVQHFARLLWLRRRLALQSRLTIQSDSCQPTRRAEYRRLHSARSKTAILGTVKGKHHIDVYEPYPSSRRQMKRFNVVVSIHA